MSYLIHFNGIHDKLGRFGSGDGDGDGIIDDNHNRQYSPREMARIERKDSRWAKRHYNSIYKKSYRPVKKEMGRYVKKELNKKYKNQLIVGKVSKSYMNEYNRKLADLMNSNMNTITAPSGRVVRFVAKRGEIGVHMALADPQYDMSSVKNGVFGSGKVAYKNSMLIWRKKGGKIQNGKNPFIRQS